VKNNKSPEANLNNIGEKLSGLSPKDRIIVQVGQCSEAVGAGAFYNRVVETFKDVVEISIGGCDGACFAAPRAVSVTQCDSQINERLWALNETRFQSEDSLKRAVDGFFSGQFRLTMKDIGILPWDDLGQFIGTGGFHGFAKALDMSPEEVITVVSNSSLRGRGGAYFPVGLKWESAARFSDMGKKTQLIINAEEGEPGVFKDRHLMEGLPYRVIEGALIAAWAVAAEEVYLYVNAEAKVSYERLNYALKKCLEHGIVGNNVLGTNFNVKVSLHRGAGGYVCGEESTLINTLEGSRREPRLRPPFPTESGLNNLPTVINNVETICNLPYILSEGPDEFKKLGTSDALGTKIVSLSGALSRSGVAEVEMGTSLRDIIESIGGEVIEGNLSSVAVGGPSSGVLPIEKLDLRVGPGFIDGNSVMIGAGGIIGIGKGSDPLETIRNLAEYNANESCGKCTPCREGTPRILGMLKEMRSGAIDVPSLGILKDLCSTVNAASLCGLGQAAGNPALSYLEYFSDKAIEGIQTGD